MSEQDREHRAEQAARRFREGIDRAASYETVYQALSKDTLASFRRRGFRPRDAEDLNQELWLRVYRGLDDFRGDCPLKAWVFMLARTTWQSHLRTRETAKRKADVVSIDAGPVIAQAAVSEPRQHQRAVAGEELEALQRALLEMPPQMRRCLELRVMQERSVKETAIILQVAEGTVKAQLHQARAKLRELMREHFEDPADPDDEGTDE